MRSISLFLALIFCCSLASAQEFTPSDPFGLSAFGFKQKLENRPLMTPAGEPSDARACGTGVYMREEPVTVNKKVVNVRVVMVYFSPDPATLPVLRKYVEQMNPGPESPDLPPGTSSITFLWPTKLRSYQTVLLTRADYVDAKLIQRKLSFPAKLDVQEGDPLSILWRFDHPVAGAPAPELLGNSKSLKIGSEPMLFRLLIPRGAKKCIEGKTRDTAP
jgi:hypothetical protein